MESLVAHSLRIDAKRDDEAVINWIKSTFESYLIVHEYGDITEKPHFHALVYFEPKKRRKLADRLVAEFPRLRGKGRGSNGSYSLAVCRSESAFKQYCCKGTRENAADVVACNWMAPPNYEEERKAYWVMQAERDKQEETLCGKAMKWWAGHQMWFENSDENSQRLQVAEWLVEQQVLNGKPVLKNYLKSIVNTVCAANSVDHKRSLARDIADGY